MEKTRRLAKKVYTTAIDLEQKERQLEELNTHIPLSSDDSAKQKQMAGEIVDLKQVFKKAIAQLPLNPKNSTSATP